MSASASQQEDNKQAWISLVETLNRGDFVGSAAFFHPEFQYVNPSRPDLTGYESWIASPRTMWDVFPPCRYAVKDLVAHGDDQVWVYCHHYGVHTGGPYMGVQPAGREINVEWFSIVSFKDGKIVQIFSIADVLGMLIQIGVLDPSRLPTQPFGE